jgi:glycosyltransferase involved in cell wall biosynthesis
MRVAIIHPWFLFSGGGERVTGVLAGMYPQADVFALFSDDRFLPSELRGRQIKTSFLEWLPGAHRFYRQLMPLYAVAAETLDVSGYDLVISSCSSVCKGVLTDQSAVHICYCHTPTRFIWDYYGTFLSQRSAPLRPLFAGVAHFLRMWDYQAAQRVDHFAANSHFIANRIHKYYRRESSVIYPPIETRAGYLERRQDNYYLSVGRLTHTKRIDLLIEACNRLGRRLVIAGTGREEVALKRIAGPSIEFLGRVNDAALPDLYAKCRAFLFAAEEDLGMVPLEAQSYGRPVIAYGKGGSRETVRGYGQSMSPTGVFFNRQTADDVAAAIVRYEDVAEHFNPSQIRAHAVTFDTSVFVNKMSAFISAALNRDEVNELKCA